MSMKSLFPKTLYPDIRNKTSKNPFSREQRRGAKTIKLEDFFKMNMLKPRLPFDPLSMGPSEILKKENLCLITNSTIKKIVLKFRESEKKIREERKFVLRTRSSHLSIGSNGNNNRLEREKTPNYMKGKNKDVNYYGYSTNYNIGQKNIKFPRSGSCEILPNKFKIRINSKNAPSTETKNNKNKTQLSFSATSSNTINDFSNTGMKFLLKNRATSRKKVLDEIEKKKLRILNSNYRKINQDCVISLVGIKSSKLDTISLFGVFEGNGPQGRLVASLVRQYLVDYFEKSSAIIVDDTKGNFYSILCWAFVNTQNYLIKHQAELKINLQYSGCTGCILLFPHNNTNMVYCANLGRCKCVMFSNSGTTRLSFELCPDRASEKERILEYHRKNFVFDNKENLDTNNRNKKDMRDKNKNSREGNLNKNSKNNKNDNNNNNSSKNNNSSGEIKITNNPQENKNEKDNLEKSESAFQIIIKDIMIKKNQATNNIENGSILSGRKRPGANQNSEKVKREKFLKQFLEMDISRTMGNLAFEELGIIPEPEINEANVRLNRGKFAILGTASFWKWVTNEEAAAVARKYILSYDSLGASRELVLLARDKMKSLKNDGSINVVVLFFSH